jgi:DNA modification methylase
MIIVERKIKELIAAEYNPRQLTKGQFKHLSDSLTRFGVVDPVIVNKHKDRDNIIVGGHQRLKVWESLGNETIPTVEVDLVLDMERELNVRLNKNSGEWDYDILNNNFDKEELLEFGFDETELTFFEPDVVLEAEEDNYDMPDQVQVDVVLGDLIEIGEHRLLCGDSTCSDTVAKLMDGKKADMVFTDPPYGISYDSPDDKHDIILNDDTFLTEWMPQVMEHSTGFIFMWTSYQVVGNWIGLTKDYFGDITNMIVWSKGGGGLGDLYKRFATDYELCLVWNRGETIKGKRIGCVWDIPKDSTSSYMHPTQKPIELMSKGITNCSLVNSTIMDLFLGSGSTMVASHQLKRKCYGMELDPKYCQVIIDRMTKLDPVLKVKINGVKYIKNNG